MNKVYHGLVLNLNSSVRNKSFIHTSKILKSKIQPSKDAVTEESSARISDLNMLKVGIREKYLLVWGGKYKRLRDVPAFENQHVLEKARNKARVKINILMGVATMFGCMIMVYIGKKEASQGQNTNTMYAKYREDLKSYETKKQE